MQTRSVAALASAFLAITMPPSRASGRADVAGADGDDRADDDADQGAERHDDARDGPTTAPGGAMKAPRRACWTLALDARPCAPARAAGYTLTGQALVKDPCQAARFDPSLLTIYPPQYNLDQFRVPGSMGMLCIQRLTWVTATPRMVSSTNPPAYVTVRTKKGATRVSIR